ncbi:MAG TPA: ABC transporter substrate-binding protein [Nevskiaceae bacterium]
MIRKLAVCAVAAVALSASAPVFAACTTTIGAIMSVTGPLGVLGEPIAKVVDLAAHDINTAGGVNGCELKVAMLDDQTNPTISVDAAKKLVDIDHVPVIIGPVASGPAQAVLTSVVVPSKVVMITPTATSPVFTQLAKEGKTGGWFFRTAPSDALQGAGMAQVAWDAGYRNVAVLALNSAYGRGLGGAFITAYKNLGGHITHEVFYDASQASYRSEVTRAMTPKPDAVFLVGYPGDGTLLTREWIAAGGTQHLLLSEGLQSESYIKDVGAKYFQKAHGTAPGSATTPSTKIFTDEVQAAYKIPAAQPFIDNTYDAVVVAALAMDEAKSDKPEAIRAAMRKVTDPDGTKIYAGPAELKKGLQLIAEGKPIRYVGASGPLQFDQYGDVLDPLRTWKVLPNGKIDYVSEISVGQLEKLVRKLH